MGQLHTSLVLFLLFCSPWPSNGKTFLTHLGTRCIEDCKKDWGDYKCKTIDKDGKCQEMYCSPQENMDYWGRQCSADSKCEKQDKDYYWCKVDNLQWGYCGLLKDDKNHYGSTTGALCYNNCEQRDSNYYWCNTAAGWDYCSPAEKTDYQNKQCKEDSPCGKQSHDYNWCWLKEESWGYCGLVETKMFLHRSKDHYVCTDECQYYARGDYYWCHTANSWDYCSPDVDVTYKDKPCRSDHSCGLHGYSYNWCWTSHSGYDYCGPIDSAECTYITSKHRKRRAPGNIIMVCTKVEKDYKIETTFTAESQDNNAANGIADGHKWIEQVQGIIARWNNGYLVNQPRSNLTNLDNLHIDMQRRFKRNNQWYYNIQIQLSNEQNQISTTFSEIIVPDGIPEHYIHRAFWESFRRRARVLVYVSRLHQC